MVSAKTVCAVVCGVMPAFGALQFPHPLPDTLTYINHTYGGDRFQGLNVVVFGGTSGIGFASAAMFVQECATRMVIVARNAKQGELAANVLRNMSLDHCKVEGTIEYLRADVTKRGEVRQVFDRFRSTGKLEVVVNTAAIGGYIGNLADMPEDILLSSHDSVFNNVYGATTVTSEALRFWGMVGCDPSSCPKLDYMPALVHLSSEQGMTPCPRCSMYSTSKHAIIGLTTSIAASFAKHIRANVVLPTLVDTPFTWNQARNAGYWPNGTVDLTKYNVQVSWQCVIDGKVIEDGDCPGGGTGFDCPCEDMRHNDPRVVATWAKAGAGLPVSPNRIGASVLDLADPTATTTGASIIVDVDYIAQCTEGLTGKPLWDSCPRLQQHHSSMHVV